MSDPYTKSIEFLFPGKLGWLGKSLEFCSKGLLKENVTMYLKTSVVESWLFWTGRTKACQRPSPWEEEKVPRACLLLVPGIGPKILSSEWLCPEPLALLHWSA